MNGSILPVQSKIRIISSILLSLVFGGIQAQYLSEPGMSADEAETSGNPFITHDRGADPSAQVWNDGQVWVYASHDQDDATDYSSMDGYRAYSSYDMVNWTDHGEILHSRDVSWGTPVGGKMFAPDAAYKDGKYYLYFPHPDVGWSFKVGVAISDKPEGPFIDIGNYIEGTDGIDPTCFIDDDGTAYLMWGGDHQPPRIARLKENMIELAEEPRTIEYGADDFFEAGFIHKYNGKYYFSYNCNTCWPNTGRYGIGDHPYGPYEDKGVVSGVPDGAQIHNSMIEYHGQWYYFYHMGNYNDGSMYRRNLCMDSMFYNPDGTIQEVIHTTTGVGADPIGSTTGHLIPGKFEAENYFSTSGIDSLTSNDTTLLVNIDSGDVVTYVLDILGSEEYDLSLRVKDAVAGSVVYCLVDEVVTDTLILESEVETAIHTIFLHKGKHTLSLQFESTSISTDLVKVDWIELRGDIIYHPVEASAGTGGTISPEGTVYAAEGDSLVFSLDWTIGYQPDSILVDGAKQAPASSYTFHNVTSAHSIHADFASCDGTILTPYVTIDEGEPENASTIEATEGSQVLMSVEYDDEGDLFWTDKAGIPYQQDNFEISSLKLTHAGEYTATFTSTSGCKSQQVFDLTVNPIVLDVYEAEDFVSQSGIQSEGCADLGGGENIGYIENGDWCTYQINPEAAGVYSFIARVATSTGGGTIEMSQDGVKLGTLNVSGSLSSDWQDWYTTDPVEVRIEEGGEQTIKLSYKGGGGFLFNLNWFDLTYVRPLSMSESIDDSQIRIYPNPVKKILNIDAPYTIENIQVFNIQGKEMLASATNGKSIRLGMDFPRGIYMLKILGDRKTITEKFIIE